jgi:cytoskeleton protein RodZ
MVPEEQPKADPRSPGLLLKNAREAAGLSIDQVADKLHLLKAVVSSLEKDCYDRIRGDTFARGYLRNYARLLGMDADDIVGCFNAKAGRGSSVRAEPKVVRRREPLGGGPDAGRVGMVAALLALSGLFLFQTREPVVERAAVTEPPLTVETARGEQTLAGSVSAIGSFDAN